MPRATAKLGMPEILLDLQSVKFRPREDSFVEASYPAISAKFAYAERGSPQEKSLLAGTCSQVLHADISFNEPIDFVQEVYIEGSEVRILAYSLIDLVAEKYRAILQQTVRNRARRQDVFDLDYLISEKIIQDLDKSQLLSTYQRKCESRDIKPTKDSLDNPDVIERSKRDWATLSSEVEELPEFMQSYETVRDYYHSLPWNAHE